MVKGSSENPEAIYRSPLPWKAECNTHRGFPEYRKIQLLSLGLSCVAGKVNDIKRIREKR